MVRFIIEVDEEYIHKNADYNLALKQVAILDAGKRLEKTMDTICFSSIEEKMKNGEREFVITRDKIEKETDAVFDRTMVNLCALAGIIMK